MFIETIPTFKSTDKTRLFLKFHNRWVNYCPIDGVGLDVQDALFVFLTFVHKGYHYLVVKPKFNEGFESYEEGWKENFFLFRVYKFKLKDMPRFANIFNSGACVFKVEVLEFNDESLFMVAQQELTYSKRVDSNKEIDSEFRKFMKTLT